MSILNWDDIYITTLKTHKNITLDKHTQGRDCVYMVDVREYGKLVFRYSSSELYDCLKKFDEVKDRLSSVNKKIFDREKNCVSI